MSTIQLKPGILVSLKTSVTGGVTYDRITRRDYGVRYDDGSWLRPDGSVTESGKTDGAFAGTAEEAEKLSATAFGANQKVTRLPDIDDAGREVRRWETVKTVADPVEHREAGEARHEASKAISKLCIRTVFGLLCPLSREAELAAAIERARSLAEEHNAKARSTRVAIYILRGTIASTDEEAARAIGEEVRGLVEAMNSGISKLDVEAIREAASKAAALSEMLSDAQVEILSEAVRAARSAARTIAKRVEKEGEAAAIVRADIKRGALEKARLAFLDLSDEAEVPGETAPAANVQRVAGIDLDDDFGARSPEEADIAEENAAIDVEAAVRANPEDELVTYTKVVGEGWYFESGADRVGPFDTREQAERARTALFGGKAVA